MLVVLDFLRGYELKCRILYYFYFHLNIFSFFCSCPRLNWQLACQFFSANLLYRTTVLLFYVLLCTLCTSLHLWTLLFCIYYYCCCCTVCTALLFSYWAIFIAASVRNKLTHSFNCVRTDGRTDGGMAKRNAEF